jgi:hypothetical protein
MLVVSSDKASTTHPPIRRAVDNLVKPESNSDAIEPDYQPLKAVENPDVAFGFEKFWQRFGNGNKKGEKCLAVIY